MSICRYLLAVTAFATLFCVSSSHAAFIDPADGTGTFGIDPNAWAANMPLPINTNTIATLRTLTPWTRGSANTTYQGWDRFTSALNGANNPNTATGANEVDADPVNPNGTATMLQLTPGAFLTSGLNIYSPSTPTTFSTVIPNYNLGAGYQTNFLVQFRAATGDFNFSGIQLNGVSVTTLANYSLQLLNTATYNAGFGDAHAVDYKLEFTVNGNAALDTLTFASLAEGLSFDKASIDTSVTAIPEPTALLSIAAAGLAGITAIRRRSR